MNFDEDCYIEEGGGIYAPGYYVEELDELGNPMDDYGDDYDDFQAVDL